MRQLAIAVSTIAVAALFVTAPASAEKLEGGPIKQNGQCWKKHSVGSDMTWGTWAACPTPAAAPAIARPARKRA
jgi:hypothetical protein